MKVFLVIMGLSLADDGLEVTTIEHIPFDDGKACIAELNRVERMDYANVRTYCVTSNGVRIEESD